MKRIRKIMVAYDISDYSKEALVFASELADELKSDLMVVNVINQREVDAVKRAEMEAVSFSADQFIKDRKKDRLEQINQIIEEISAKHLPIEIKIKTGVPFRELIQAAKDGGVDLVVMGRKGRSNLAGIFFGTTAEKMFRHCPVPLLSLRKDMHR
jgi:nucleotide-binding universal stress UspA family protein